jgi:NAD(P)-dependent dehydrogenase (short-subunit alcohol dehydrogenase family)
LDFDDLQGERKFNSLTAFGATKMANLLFTFELARRLAEHGVTVNAIHPGLVKSSLMREASAPIRFLTGLFSSPPDRAAREIVRWALSPEAGTVTGNFLHKDKVNEAAPYALDERVQRRLWEISESLTDAREQGPNYDPTGSVAMHNEKNIPEKIIRPEDQQVENPQASEKRK